jgi:hypothetical protein
LRRLRSRRDVLPPREEAHELCRSDGFHFAPELAEREPMDAGEDAPVAPFDLGFPIPGRGGETAAQDLAF